MPTYNLSPNALKKYQDALTKYNGGTVTPTIPNTDTTQITPKVNTTGLPGIIGGTGAGLMAGANNNTGMVGTGTGIATGVNNYSQLSNFSKPVVNTPKASTDPYADRMNAVLDKVLGFDPNAAYDVTTDPLYNPLKQQYEQAGKTAFNNQIGSLSAMTGGRPSTAAVGTATGAQNKYAQDFAGVVLPGLIDAESQRRINGYNTIVKQLGVLQDMSNTNYNRGRDTMNDTGKLADGTFTQSGMINNQNIQANDTKSLASKAATIAAANYNDIQAYIDTLAPNDPLIPYLQAERNNKIAAEEAKKVAGEKEAYDRTKADNKAELDKRYTEAQINNIYADNARQAESSKPTNIAEMGTPEQLNYFNNAFTYLLNQNGGDGYKAYQQLMKERVDYNASMGSKLFNELASQLQAYGKSQGTPTSINNNQGLTYTDYFNEASKKLKQTNNFGEYMYSDTDIGAYINGLPLSNADKERLADDLGLPK